jgi:hypothetical protein
MKGAFCTLYAQMQAQTLCFQRFRLASRALNSQRGCGWCSVRDFESVNAGRGTCNQYSRCIAKERCKRTVNGSPPGSYQLQTKSEAALQAAKKRAHKANRSDLLEELYALEQAKRK